MRFDHTFSNTIIRKKISFLITYLIIAAISAMMFVLINITDTISIEDVTTEIWLSFAILNSAGIFSILAFVEYIRIPPQKKDFFLGDVSNKKTSWNYSLILRNISKPEIKKHIIKIKLKNRKEIKAVRKIYANLHKKENSSMIVEGNM